MAVFETLFVCAPYKINQIERRVASQGLRTFLFYPDVPAADVLKLANGVTAQQPEQTPSGYWTWVRGHQHLDGFPSGAHREPIAQGLAQQFAHPLESGNSIMAFGSLVVLIALETLLRFRTITALTPKERRLIAPMRDSARLGVRHFGTLVGHVGLLGLFIGIIGLTFVEAPMVVAQALAVPRLGTHSSR